MADSATLNQNLILPEIGASKDSWGTKINQNFTKIDSLLKVGLGTFVNRAGDTLTGFLNLHANPTSNTHAANKLYVDTQSATKLPLSGGTLTGFLNLHANPTSNAHAANKLYVDNQVATRMTQGASDGRYVLKTLADTITGVKTFSETPVIERTARISMPLSGGDTVELQYVGTRVGYYSRTSNRWELYTDVGNGELVPRGQVFVASDPLSPGHLARKAYVDAQVAGRLTQAQGDSRYVNMDLPRTSAQSINGRVNFYAGGSASTDAAARFYDVSGNARATIAADGSFFSSAGVSVGSPDTGSAGGKGAELFHGPAAVGLNLQMPSSFSDLNLPVIRAFLGTQARFRVELNGNVMNTNNSYGSLSDARFKENIVDAQPQLDDMLSLRVVNFNLIGDDDKQVGLIAQEVRAVKPRLVAEDEDGTLSLKYSVLVPLMLKALRELNSKVDALSA